MCFPRRRAVQRNLVGTERSGRGQLSAGIRTLTYDTYMKEKKELYTLPPKPPPLHLSHVFHPSPPLLHPRSEKSRAVQRAAPLVFERSLFPPPPPPKKIAGFSTQHAVRTSQLSPFFPFPLSFPFFPLSISLHGLCNLLPPEKKNINTY